MIINIIINTTDAAHYIADVQKAVNAIIDYLKAKEKKDESKD